MLDEIMCHRVGAPPLRFRGALLSHRETPGDGAERLFLSLWARQTKKKHDLVVAFSDRRCDWRAHALVAPDLEGAIRIIEDRCDSMYPSVGTVVTDPATQDDLIAAMQKSCSEAVDIQRFRQLAAVALDQWLTLHARGGASTETDMMKGT